jgi:hypothetical protein
MRAWPAQGKSRRRPRRRSDGGVEAVAPCKAGLGRREPVGEHLNEATITWLGSIPECGNTPAKLIVVRQNRRSLTKLRRTALLFNRTNSRRHGTDAKISYVRRKAHNRKHKLKNRMHE